MTGVEMIAREREEQIKLHGYTSDHDAEVNQDGELLKAAMYMITDDDTLYPSNWDRRCKQVFDEKPAMERYTIAGALIAAHIDRMQNHLKLKTNT